MNQLDSVIVENAANQAQSLLQSLSTVILGQHELLEQMLVVLLASGHALLEGVPGTAKTLAACAAAQSLDAQYKRIQFTPDLMPSDITGLNMLNEQSRQFEFHPGPVFADIVLADEINRAPAKTQAALLEAMQERHVTVDGTTHPLPEEFTVFATQNPVEYEGTYPLPEAQLDRFLLKVCVDYPDQSSEIAILDRYAQGFDATDSSSFQLPAPLPKEWLRNLRMAVRRVYVAPNLRAYIVALARATREDSALHLGASPRACVALFRASQAYSLLQGRAYAIPEDIKSMTAAVFRHRLILGPDAHVAGETVEGRIHAILNSVKVPSEGQL